MKILSWKIGTKLTVAFGVLVSTMLLTAMVNWIQVGKADDATSDAIKRARILRKVDNLVSAMVDQETGVRGYLIAGDPAFLEPYKQGQTKLSETADALEAEWSDSPDQLQRLEAFLASASKWKSDIADREIALMANPATQSQARQFEMSGAGKATMDAMRAGASDIARNSQQRMDAALAAQDTAVDTSFTTLAIASALGIVIALVAALTLIIAIARPIRSMTAYMRGLADGDTSRAVEGRDRGDEIGGMANAVEVFRQAAITNKRLEADATENRLQAEADRTRIAEEAEEAAQKRLNQATTGIAAGLKRLSSGDLAFQIDEAFAPDFEALRHDLNAAVRQLGETLTQVAQAAGTIDNGSREISSSADDLSKRTEQQAASLEETAAALDQITTNVSNSFKRAEEARHVALEANTSAAESGKVVAHAVAAMQKIEHSSEQVSNIIGVIDEIAFQTNLLALNAGVEAARAGDAGKGFAVVAQEVRELAQRSATAAKEIKELIRNSSVEVQSGVKLVKDTGLALKTIEGHIFTLNQHMDSIAVSAKEQSVGLSEVNTAVNQMDQVTQQNAAMVEETNAAGASLANESSRLRELISRFSLSSNGTRRAISMASAESQSVASTPRRLNAKIARAFSSNLAEKESWSEF